MASPTIFTPIAVDPTQLPVVGGGAATLLTAGAGGAVLDYILVVNDTTTAVVVTLYYVPSGGAAGDGNILCKALSIPGDGLGVNILELMAARPFHMKADSTIRGFAVVASQATVHIGGTDYA
ncbi:MAG: hypothetical protein MUP14_07880 [Dehalococcoidia bacterium]|nr:hypothetical protein [Dehalococcoidia bacterium]